jgi:hypothetical protein
MHECSIYNREMAGIAEAMMLVVLTGVGAG